jgi:RNA polymerase sigma-70 factor (ECF subfamily)
MEVAAAILRELPARRRARDFERECERLRPLGEAYVLRRFGGSLGRADAEDAVADVLIRLHRRMAEGRAPENLRAAFFTSVRNAAIDQLRSRSARPTAPLEAAAEAPALAAIPTERAESREDAVRLQEAIARMRGNYREAILLRFGLGLTVPEIAAHLGISLPAAKKLVLRATRQVKQRLESIEDAQFCPEMREAARHSLFERPRSSTHTSSTAAPADPSSPSSTALCTSSAPPLFSASPPQTRSTARSRSPTTWRGGQMRPPMPPPRAPGGYATSPTRRAASCPRPTRPQRASWPAPVRRSPPSAAQGPRPRPAC